MKSKPLYLSVLVGGLIAAAVFLTYPIFKSEAQKAGQGEKADPELVAKMRETSSAAIFYDNLSSRETDLVLKRFSPPSPMENQKVINMIFSKGGEEVHVGIIEYPTVEDAQMPLRWSVNSDVKEYKEHGDEGRMLYDYLGKGGFAALEFRKDRFLVSIHCKDEAMAKRLAGYAMETIRNR